MKKGLFLIIFLFCTSCSLMSENKSFEENYLIQPKFETEEHLPQYDADYRFAHSGSTVCETEDAYYGTLFDDPYYLRYYDKKSQYSGILCGKPECTHTDENCDGYIMGEVGGVRLYDNQLYWIQNMYGEGYALWCMDLNGKQRQRVQNIDAAIFSKLNTNIIMQVHRGYVYISGMGCTVWNGQSITKVMVIVYPIGKDEVVTVYDQTYTNGSADLYTQLKGNKLYIMVSSRIKDETSIIHNNLEMYCWDSAQRYMDTILCENNISYSMSSMWVESEKYIYMTDSTGNSDEISSLFQVDVKGKEFEKCFSLKHPAKKVTSACLLENMILIHAKENERYSVYILDFNGNLVCDKETTVADLREGAEGNILCGGDMEYLYYEKWYDQGSCIIQIPVQGEGGNILWESKE